MNPRGETATVAAKRHAEVLAAIKQSQTALSDRIDELFLQMQRQQTTLNLMRAYLHTLAGANAAKLPF